MADLWHRGASIKGAPGEKFSPRAQRLGSLRSVWILMAGYRRIAMGTRAPAGSALLERPALPARYRVVRRIARGGMATVWCAEDVVLRRLVAIKLLAEQLTHDCRAVRHFRR